MPGAGEENARPSMPTRNRFIGSPFETELSDLHVKPADGTVHSRADLPDATFDVAVNLGAAQHDLVDGVALHRISQPIEGSAHGYAHDPSARLHRVVIDE